MKRVLLLLFVLALAGLISYFLLRKSAPGQTEKKEAPLAISGDQGPFTRSFTVLLNEYFGMKDAFVDWDSASVDVHAVKLGELADSLPIGSLKADTSIVQTARNLAGSVSAESKGIAGEKLLAEKRKGFNTLTDQIYTLIQAVRYEGPTVYHLRCPMAFQDSVEGFWLSSSNHIVNPYLGKKHPYYKEKMLGCGELVDSLKFSSSN